MPDTGSSGVSRLILVPALITLAITVLRLVGELAHWSKLFFNPTAGGGFAIVGISWLPLILGPYFAVKLVDSGRGPSSMGKFFGLWAAALVVYIGGTLVFGMTITHPSALTLLGLLLMLASAFVVRPGWPALGNTLLAYAVAARIPVVIVMFLAMNGNGGQGWGTHYDVVPPAMAGASFWSKFVDFALLPQLTLWIGFTVTLGALAGGITAALVHRGKQATQEA